MAQINAERAAKGMSVAELAERVGIHPGSWPRYMKGERQMSLPLVERCAKALELDIRTLIRRANERNGEE